MTECSIGRIMAVLLLRPDFAAKTDEQCGL